MVAEWCPHLSTASDAHIDALSATRLRVCAACAILIALMIGKTYPRPLNVWHTAFTFLETAQPADEWGAVRRLFAPPLATGLFVFAPRRLSRPRHPEVISAAVIRCAHYPGTPANWCAPNRWEFAEKHRWW